MVKRPDAFIAFVERHLQDVSLSVREFDRKTGDRFSNLTLGRQKPPIATLHKWADALQLDRAGRLRLFQLADEAHGGGTILSVLIDELERLEKEADERDRLIAKLSVKIDQIERSRNETRS